MIRVLLYPSNDATINNLIFSDWYFRPGTDFPYPSKGTTSDFPEVMFFFPSE
jgi:hypothetical protein